MDTPEIHQLVIKAKQRDHAAFAELYDIFGTRVSRFICGKVPGREQREDILQDTFIKVWRYLPNFDETQLYFGAWVYRISRNLINDHYRHTYRHPVAGNIDDYPNLTLTTHLDLQAKMDVSLATDRVNSLLPFLSENYKRVIDLRFRQGLSIKETAEKIGRSSLSVRVSQHRAIKKLSVLTHELPASVGLNAY
jgi:RNA polymerase sigma-70 factor, ECF subfamily